MLTYLIIGNGRLAKHFNFYLTQLNFYVKNWNRKSTDNLAALAKESKRILLLISDNEIQNFIEDNSYLKNHYLVHCSGSRSIQHAKAAHPLNTFGPELYDLEVYKKTPFVIDSTGPHFSDILPGLTNTNYTIDPTKKSLYHALCVLSGNFSTLLWQNTIERFTTDLSLPPEALAPYMKNITANLQTHPQTALTGPLSRGDTSTVIRNLEALSRSEEQNLYYAFLNYYFAKNKKTGDLAHEHLGV